MSLRGGWKSKTIVFSERNSTINSMNSKSKVLDRWYFWYILSEFVAHRWNISSRIQSRGAFCCACAKKVCSARSAPFRYFQRAFAGFQLSDRHLSVILFGKGWKSMTSLPPFLTLWILVEFAGSSDEDILMIKVRTKREKRPKTWSLRFDLLTIKMCTRDYKPWRLVLRGVWRRSWDIRFDNRR